MLGDSPRPSAPARSSGGCREVVHLSADCSFLLLSMTSWSPISDRRTSAPKTTFQEWHLCVVVLDTSIPRVDWHGVGILR